MSCLPEHCERSIMHLLRNILQLDFNFPELGRHLRVIDLNSLCEFLGLLDFSQQLNLRIYKDTVRSQFDVLVVVLLTLGQLSQIGREVEVIPYEFCCYAQVIRRL